jgi:nicotinate-nucleotide adenylyltransferase
MRSFEGRTVLFGGTFNPVHYGHLRPAEEVRELFSLKQILFIPSADPPLKREDIAPSEDRLRMVKMATEKNPFFDVSAMECDRPGKSYTVDTLREYIRKNPGERPLFLIGSDAFLEIPLWHNPEEIISLTDFIIIRRPGPGLETIRGLSWIRSTEETGTGEVLIRIEGAGAGGISVFTDVTQIEISASEIRRSIREGRSIRYLVPEKVEMYIYEKELYRVRA